MLLLKFPEVGVQLPELGVTLHFNDDSIYKCGERLHVLPSYPTLENLRGLAEEH